MPDDAAIHLEPYDETWPQRFAAEATLITQVIGPWITGGVHHIGSTAIPGLVAKPVIDIMAGVEDLESSRECIELLESLDYCYAPYRTDVMHWFCKPHPSHRTHHLHLVPTGSSRFTDVLAFRDHLRQNPEALAEYETLKRELADRFRHDREAYTEGKSDLIAELIRAAKTP